MFVLSRMQLLDGRWKALSNSRNCFDLIPPGSDHNLVGKVVPSARFYRKYPGVVGPKMRYQNPFPKRWIERSCVGLEVLDDFFLGHKPVWIISVIVESGKLALPIRCHHTKTVPPFRSPSFAQSVLLTDEMIDTPSFHTLAHCQTGLAATNNDDGIMQIG